MATRRIRRKGSKSRKGKGRRITRRRQSGGGCSGACPSSPTKQHVYNPKSIMSNRCIYCGCYQ
jgi:hypothetical protein